MEKRKDKRTLEIQGKKLSTTGNISAFSIPKLFKIHRQQTGGIEHRLPLFANIAHSLYFFDCVLLLFTKLQENQKLASLLLLFTVLPDCRRMMLVLQEAAY